MMNQTPPSQLPCPQCKKTVLWNEDFPFRPFCSKRCQLIDLGQWAQEEYSIPISGNDESDGQEWS